MRRVFLLTAVFSLLVAVVASAQESKPLGPVSPLARLAAAKTAFLKSVPGGSDIPFEVIRSAFEAWPRFLLVDSPDKADIIIEISAPVEQSLSASNNTSGKEKPKPTPKDLSYISEVKMVVSDPRTHLTLWLGRELPKSKEKKTRDEKNVDAAQRLFTRFRDQIEPPPPEEKKP